MAPYNAKVGDGFGSTKPLFILAIVGTGLLMTFFSIRATNHKVKGQVSPGSSAAFSEDQKKALYDFVKQGIIAKMPNCSAGQLTVEQKFWGTDAATKQSVGDLAFKYCSAQDSSTAVLLVRNSSALVVGHVNSSGLEMRDIVPVE